MKNEYLGIKKYPNNITSYPITIHLYDAVRNGTPLTPKVLADLLMEERIIGANQFTNEGVFYFESREKARQAIDAVGEDRIKKYYLEVEG